MMKKVFITIIFLMVFSKSNAQIPKNGFVGIDIYPVNPYTAAPRWTVGYHHRINERYFAGLKFGYADDALINNIWYNALDENYHSFYISGELIYLVKPLAIPEDKGHWKMFFFSDMYYISHKETLINKDYIPENTDEYISFERADYEREKYGINLGTGFFIPIYNSIYLIPKAGIGPSIRNVQFENISGIHDYVDEEYQHDFPFVQAYREVEGQKWVFNIYLEFKIAYTF